jgi:hypothetical protein
MAFKCLEKVVNDIKEDTHFYLDYAPPDEVTNVLRILSVDYDLTTKDIADALRNDYGFEMQKDRTYSPRRLADLGLAIQSRRGSVAYKLSELGSKIKNILGIDPALAMDLMHYLHYTGYTDAPTKRKYLWSYRRCCQILWDNMRIIKYSLMASAIQSEMQEKFPWLDYGKKAGARFDSTAASRVGQWLKALDPPPFDQNESTLIPRIINRHEVALLGLDEIYCSRGYTYGDPVLMDDDFIKQVSGVFMLDFECCKKLLQVGARINQSVRISETLAGASISLMKPFKISNI